MTASFVIERGDFGALLTALTERGYTIVGPTVRDRAIVLDEIAARRGPARRGGPTSRTEAATGSTRRDDEALFGYAVGPQSYKQFQLPVEPHAVAGASRGQRRADAGRRGSAEEPPRYAFLGARSCELHAMGILGHVLTGGRHPGPCRRGTR